MSKPVGCILQFVLVLVDAFIGYLTIGINVPDYIHKGIFNSWKRFHLPGGNQASQFIKWDDATVMVSADQGKRYLHHLSFDEEPGWVEVFMDENQPDFFPPSSQGAGGCSKTEMNSRLIVRPFLRSAKDRLYCWHSPMLGIGEISFSPSIAEEGFTVG
jgi:hypothetical protein